MCNNTSDLEIVLKSAKTLTLLKYILEIASTTYEMKLFFAYISEQTRCNNTRNFKQHVTTQEIPLSGYTIVGTHEC